MFATVARAHMDRYGTSADHLAAVAMQNRRAAALHPNAHYREAMDLAAYHESCMIADGGLFAMHGVLVLGRA